MDHEAARCISEAVKELHHRPWLLALASATRLPFCIAGRARERVSIQSFFGCVPLIKHILPDFYVHGMGDPRIEHLSPLSQGRIVILSKANVFGAIHLENNSTPLEVT
jgi:hypothetical protein